VDVTDPHRAAEDVRVAEEWDEGLSPQRTQLAWGRTGLAMAAAVVVLARRAWLVGGALEAVSLAVVGVGGVVWLIGMQRSRDLHVHMEPHGLAGGRAFWLITIGTVLLAAGAVSLGVTLHR
jgi:uncharacterized membrane protein YidH (DUF202 family)